MVESITAELRVEPTCSRQRSAPGFCDCAQNDGVWFRQAQPTLLPDRVGFVSVTAPDFRRRAIFVDIDGTLMDHEIVDPSAPGAIAQARANGHLVFVCTGRSFNGIDPGMSVMEFDGWITSGGASARIGEVVIRQSAMGVAAVKRMTDFFDEHNMAYILESDDGVYCSQEVRDLFQEFWQERLRLHAAELAKLGLPPDTGEREKFLHFLPIEQANLHTISKATFLSRESDSYEKALHHLGEEYHLVPGSIPMPGGSSGEIAAAGVTKALGIEAVLDYLGMDPKDAIGIGDSWNDAEMFALCGIAVAMGNAPVDLQKRADFVTDPVLTGGVARALERLGVV